MAAPRAITKSTLRLVRRPTATAKVWRCSRCLAVASKLPSDEQWPQRTPLGSYYESLLRQPLPTLSSQTKSTQKPEEPPAPSTEEKLRLIFGSRTLTPAEEAARQATKQSQSTYIGGILVPPRPAEPDNCCMSGCVNCVWDLYREELEEWSAKNAEAQGQLKTRDAAGIEADGVQTLPRVNVDVGANKIAKDMWDEDVFQNVPVGIREFMKQEKRLKEKHEREGTAPS